MLRVHELEPVNSQLYTPSSADVTLKIIRVTFPLTQVTFTLEVKPWFTEKLPVEGSMVAMKEPSKLKVTNNRMSSSRLKLQFKG